MALFSPQYRALSTVNNGQGALSPPLPVSTSYKTGDIGLEVILSQAPITLQTPNGWAQLAQNGPSDDGRYLAVFWKRATAIPETSSVVADPGEGANDILISTTMFISGCAESGDPWRLVDSSLAVSSVNVNFPSVDTIYDNEFVVQIAGQAIDSGVAQFSGWANANLTELTERADAATATGVGGGFAISTGTKPVAGAIGNTVATLGVASAQNLLTIVFPNVYDVAFAEGVASVGGGVSPWNVGWR